MKTQLRPARPKQIDKNMIVGSVILGVIALLIFGMMILPYFQFRIFLQFDDVNKLKNGDFVYWKGHQIGSVYKITIDRQGGFLVEVILEESKLAIPNDSFFFVWRDQLVAGNKCIQIKPGISETALKNGAILRGESALRKIIPRAGLQWLKSAGLWFKELGEDVKEWW